MTLEASCGEGVEGPTRGAAKLSLTLTPTPTPALTLTLTLTLTS